MRSLTQFVQRGIQRTEEKLGNVQRTPLNEEVAEIIGTLSVRAKRTSDIVAHFEKLLKPFSEDVLRFVGDCQKELGQEEIQFVDKVADVLLNPMREYLETDLPNAAKEKNNLLTKRLTLDAAKKHLRNSTNNKQFGSGDSEVRSAQMEFDRQTDITRIIYQDLDRTESQHSKYFLKFIDAQLDHYRERTKILERHKQNISRNSNMGKPSLNESLSNSQRSGIKQSISSTVMDKGEPEIEGGGNFVTAVVTDDYWAKRKIEINVKKDDLVKAYEMNPSNENPDVWLYVERRNGRRGYIPASVLKGVGSTSVIEN